LAQYVPITESHGRSGSIYGDIVSEWRKSPLVAGIAVALFVLIQLATPISRFGDHERAQRLGWQMFSVSVPDPTLTVVTDSGEEKIMLEDYMARVRSDIDIIALMPPHLCKVVEDAAAVNWDGGFYQC
jgi:hypothetical protein